MRVVPKSVVSGRNIFVFCGENAELYTYYPALSYNNISYTTIRAYSYPSQVAYGLIAEDWTNYSYTILLSKGAFYIAKDILFLDEDDEITPTIVNLPDSNYECHCGASYKGGVFAPVYDSNKGVFISDITATVPSATEVALPITAKWCDVVNTAGEYWCVAENFNGLIVGQGTSMQKKELDFNPGTLISGNDDASAIITMKPNSDVAYLFNNSGSTFTQIKLPFAGNWSKIQYFSSFDFYKNIPNFFVVTDLDSNKFIYSKDGENWSIGTLPFSGCIGIVVGYPQNDMSASLAYFAVGKEKVSVDFTNSFTFNTIEFPVLQFANGELITGMIVDRK